MNQLERNTLHTNYMKTIFVIGDGADSVEVSPLKINLVFKELLKASRISSWAVITSDNPFSKTLSIEENNERRKNLEKELILKRYKLEPALGKDPSGQWDPELGFFIHNISLQDALEIGKEYGQNAILFGGTIGTSEIKWVEP